MEVDKRSSNPESFNHSLGGSGGLSYGSDIASSSRYSCNSAGHETSGSGSSSGLIRHSDTQFDSSTDETVIPYKIGERSSQEFISSNSIADRWDPEASPKSHISHNTRRSVVECGTLYEETVQMDIEIIRPEREITVGDTSDTEGGQEPDESERLVSPPPTYPIPTSKPRLQATLPTKVQRGESLDSLNS